MELSIRSFRAYRKTALIIGALLAALSFICSGQVYANDDDPARNGRLVTFYDSGKERVILTHAKSVKDALKDAHISTATQDKVEPSPDTELVATNYAVNIYRAHPIVVVDGVIRQKIVTAAQNPHDIVTAAHIADLRDEDKTTFTASENIVADGASTILTISRATAFTLQMYGKPIHTYSHAATVEEMLIEKDIKLTPKDTLSVNQNAPLKTNMTVAIWREGAQTATIEEPIAFSVRRVLSFDQPIGYHKVQTAGTKGTKSVTYEIIARGGREISRKIIQSVTLNRPKEQIEIVGAKPGPNALTKAKSAQQYVDSQGVTHRETYYDLNMNSVIGLCGGSGYTVRADGAKVDKDGYILVAAHLGNHPRCSIVETSMGLGRVYDTGGFAARHPQGYDLATDWTNYDGI